MKKLKICQLVNSYPLSSGGMQTYCYDISKRLSDKGHEVHVYVSGNVGEMKSEGNFILRRFKPIFHVGKATFSSSIFHNLLKEKFDIIHVHLPFHSGFEMALLASKIKNTPIIITYHCAVKSYDNNIIKRAFINSYNAFNNLLIKGVDRIIFTTKDYSNLFSFKKSKISIIPIGIDKKKFEGFNKNKSREYLSIPNSKFLILFVGNLDIHNFHKKGVEYLLKSIPLIKREIPNVLVNLVGITDKNTEEIIKKICKDNNIQENVHVLGYVSSKNLPYYYSASDIFILPSVSKLEAFGIVLLEAMASGLPVIASNIPGVRAVAKSSKSGFIVKPGSITDIAKKVILVSKLKNLKKYSIDTINSKYTWDKIISNLEKEYIKLLNKKK